MTAEILFITILAVVVLNYIIEQIIDFLNACNFKKAIPEVLSGIYDNIKYKRQQQYHYDKYRYSIITSLFSFLCIFLMLTLKGFSFVNDFVYSISENSIVQSLLFFFIVFGIYSLLQIPFNIYNQFVIEEKYKFNRCTGRLFFSDLLKSYTITILLGGGILFLILIAYNYLPIEFFWIIVLSILIIISLLSVFYNNIILSLFNKFSPLEDGRLKIAIEKFAKKVNFNLKSIVVMDGTKRSTKANAFFTGIGRRKKIVLYDSLIAEMSDDEILAVLAHEIGHYKKRHILKSMFFSILETAIMLFIFGLFAKSNTLSQSLSVETANFHIALIAFAIIYSPLSTILNIFINMISRKHENEADKFAKEQGFSVDLITALKKLSSYNMINLTPHKLTVLFYHSHPPLQERIENLQKTN